MTNTGNRIEAGTLDVDLLMDKDKDGTYTSIAGGTGDIFSEETGNGILWEPGKTEIVYLAVQNKGSLALNYNLLLDVTDGDPGLVGALEYAVIDGAKAENLTDVTTWAGLLETAGVQTGDIAAGQTVAAPNGTLDEIVRGEAAETDYFALAVHMKETAGNEYRGGSITIDLSLIAKQATAETDGFGSDQYDKDADWGVVRTAEELTEAITEGRPAVLADDITLSSIETSQDVSVDLNQKTLNIDIFEINDGNVEFKNGTVRSDTTFGKLDVRPSASEGVVTVTFENVTFDNVRSHDNDVGSGAGNLTDNMLETYSGGKATEIILVFKNCTFNNSSVDFNYNDKIDATFENCTFNCQVTNNNVINFKAKESKLTVNNCNFTVTSHYNNHSVIYGNFYSSFDIQNNTATLIASEDLREQNGNNYYFLSGTDQGTKENPNVIYLNNTCTGFRNSDGR